jgi:hypothetical protein
MKLPDDMFKQELLPYLTVDDIVNLDNACMNHKYRPQILAKIVGVILIGEKDQFMKASLFKWLGIRRIYLMNILIVVSSNYFLPSFLKNFNVVDMENNYDDQFRYTQHVVMRGPIRDDMAIFIISHCPCLLSFDISALRGFSSLYPQVTDLTLQLIAEYCTGLQSLSLSCCLEITDAGLMTIFKHCSNLISLQMHRSSITDSSMISISTHCTGLLSVNLRWCGQITDASIISISTHCIGLQSLNLESCDLITDVSIISISIHCIGLKSLNLVSCGQITDVSITSISFYCTGLQSLSLVSCDQITDVSIISISIHCSGLHSVNLESFCKITDVCIISISFIV